ncbi:NTP transferase domain-containing protein [Sphingomonas sp.]|uniref:NTP transferase domain-containing protein n=1 Tax=Sphingomonas sp. TaxID=28214 RepID=UPI002B99EABB|nr:NTP transferase domain-containing protein [Sphingomonas sp.]HTG38415.1 NTP transferase domain-containing protein [Sphingomonas sp.]
MIRTAVVLAAGEGSRLREAAASKPLCPVAGRPLIDHALAGLAAAGMDRAVVVLGYRGQEVARHIASRPQPLLVDLVWSDPSLPNGVSVMMAEPMLGNEDALLAMCDHLVDPALYASVAGCGAGPGLTLGIDRRLGHDWVDPLDVTRVATSGDRIIAIGKGLQEHDAYDTGVFVISEKLTAMLKTLASPSLTEGVRLLADRGEARVVDVSGFAWIDVDEVRALTLAERYWGR